MGGGTGFVIGIVFAGVVYVFSLYAKNKESEPDRNNIKFREKEDRIVYLKRMIEDCEVELSRLEKG